MDFLRAIWRPLIAAAILFCLAILLLMLRQRNVVGDWAQVLFFVLMGVALILALVSSVSVAIATIRKFPQYKSATVEWYKYMIISAMIMPLGYVCSLIFNGPIAYEKELAQGVLTASSVLMALSGVLLTIARFPKTTPGPQDIVTGLFRRTLILSLFAGFASIFFVLLWFAKAKSGFLEWAGFTFFVQLGYVLIFLFFPKYYTR